jgi:hypothetical protein
LSKVVIFCLRDVEKAVFVLLVLKGSDDCFGRFISRDKVCDKVILPAWDCRASLGGAGDDKVRLPRRGHGASLRGDGGGGGD